MREGLLDSLAAMAPNAVIEQSSDAKPSTGGFNVPEWIPKYAPGAVLTKDGSDGGAMVWELPECPWNPDHKKSAFIKLWHNGRIGAGCHHNSCSSKDWHALRDALEPGWRDKKPPKRQKAFVEIAAYQPFPVDAVPEPVRGWIVAASKALGCDPAYVALPMLISLTSAVGVTRRIRFKNTWAEPIIMWGGIVGESGTLKSPAIDLATEFLQRRQADAIARYNEEMEGYQRELQLYEADVLQWRHHGRKKGEPAPDKPKEPRCHRCVVDDVTVEALAERLQIATRGLLVIRDELSGWIGSFNQYKARGRGADEANWLKIHGARSLIIDRKSGVNKTIFVPRAGVCIVGGIQPGILRRVLSAEHFESGCSARLLLCMPPAPAKRWSEATVVKSLHTAMDYIFERLLALDFAMDEQGKEQAVDLTLTPSGKSAWIEFYNEHAIEQADLAGDLAAMWSKLEGYAGRFALLIHLLRWAAEDSTLANKNQVDERSVQSGASLARWFGAEARRIYAVMGDDPDTADMRRTVSLIRRKGGEITIRELQQSDRRFQSAESAEAELSKLVAAQLGVWTSQPAPSNRGPAKRVFRLSTPSTGNTSAETPDENAKPVDVDREDATDFDKANDLLSEAGDDQDGGEEWKF